MKKCAEKIEDEDDDEEEDETKQIGGMHMNGNGKIARLPRPIREQLNQRLVDNEPGGTLLKWLNGAPAVQAVLKRDFGGLPVSKQNLSEWRTGGFKRWQAQRELLEQAQDLAVDADELRAVAEGRLTEHVATVLSARYAAVLSGWDGEMSEELRQQLRMLSGMCRDIVALRRGDFHSARLKMEQEAADREREKTEEELVGYFQEWIKNTKVRKLVVQDHQLEQDERPRGKRKSLRVTDPRSEVVPDGHQVKGHRSKPQDRKEPNRVKVSQTSLNEGDERLRRLFRRQPAAGEQETDDAKTQRGRPESKRVKAGHTKKLEQLDAALAENTGSEVSEAEKTRNFMRTIFGEPPPLLPEGVRTELATNSNEEVRRQKAEVSRTDAGGTPALRSEPGPQKGDQSSSKAGVTIKVQGSEFKVEGKEPQNCQGKAEVRTQNDEVSKNPAESNPVKADGRQTSRTFQVVRSRPTHGDTGSGSRGLDG
jgi:hypothetical protein